MQNFRKLKSPKKYRRSTEKDLPSLPLRSPKRKICKEPKSPTNNRISAELTAVSSPKRPEAEQTVDTLDYGATYYSYVPKRPPSKEEFITDNKPSTELWCYSLDPNAPSVPDEPEITSEFLTTVETNLDKKFAAHRWYKLYIEEKSKAKDIHKFASDQLELLSQKHNLPRRVRLAVVCDLFESIMEVEDKLMMESAVQRIPGTPYLSQTFWKRRWQRISPLLHQIQMEMFQALFLEFDAYEHDHHSLEWNCRKFFTLKPYFHCVGILKEEVCHRREKAQRVAMEKTLKVLRARLGKVDEASLRTVFLAWKERARKMNQIRNVTCVLLGDRVTRVFLGKSFQAWRFYKTEQKKLRAMSRVEISECVLAEKNDEIKTLHHENTKIQIQYKDQINDLNIKVAELEQTLIDEAKAHEIKQIQNQVIFTRNLLAKKFKELKQKVAEQPFSVTLLQESIAIFPGSKTSKLPLEKCSCATIVLRWVNFCMNTQKLQLRYFDGKSCVDLKHDWMDGRRFLVLFKALGYTIADGDFRKRDVLKVALKRSKELMINPDIITFFDVANGRNDIIYVFLVHLMKNHPNLKMNTEFMKEKFLEFQTVLTDFDTNIKSDDAELLLELEKELLRTKQKVEQEVIEISRANFDFLELLGRLTSRASALCIARKNGKPMFTLNDASVREVSEYTKLIWEKMDNVLLMKHENNEEEARLAQSKLEMVLEEYYQTLKSAFVYYAGRGGGASTMDAKEFQVFINDIRIKDKKVSPKLLRGLFVLANMEPDEIHDENRQEEDVEEVEDENEDELYNPTDELVPSEFVELLSRIAMEKYTGEPPHKALSQLIEDHILRYSAINSDYLREYIASEDFRRVKKRLGKQLFTIFEFYSRMNAKCRNLKKEDLFLSSREFLRLLDDIGTFQTMEIPRARLVFRRAQTADDDGDEGQDNDDDALEYDEFLEAVSVIALHQNADPYLPIATRIEEYLEILVDKNKMKLC